jgi:hypothetical protein
MVTIVNSTAPWNNAGRRIHSFPCRFARKIPFNQTEKKKCEQDKYFDEGIGGNDVVWAKEERVPPNCRFPPNRYLCVAKKKKKKSKVSL